MNDLSKEKTMIVKRSNISIELIYEAIHSKLEELNLLKDEDEYIDYIDNIIELSSQYYSIKHNHYNKSDNAQINFIRETINMISDYFNYIYNIDKDLLHIHDFLKGNINSNRHTGFVYIIKDKSKDNIYKIGKTKNLNNRLDALSTGNIYIEIMASKYTAYYNILETKLHEYFKKDRIKGEWFCIKEGKIKEIIKLLGFNLHV